MSILICGMDYIPPRKPDRVYLVYHFDDEIGSFSHSICVTDKLIELQPHGRLIDADALAAEFYKQMSKQDELMELCKRAGDTSNYFTVSKIKTGMLSFLNVLNDVTTIIPAEEVQDND